MDRLMTGIARIMALLGGAILLLLVILVCVSVIGRSLVTLAYMPGFRENFAGLSGWIVNAGFGPVPGDFEVLEAGIAFAIFAFLPWCQIMRSHASVDIVTRFFSEKVNRVIDLIAEILMSAVLMLIAWRIWLGMSDKLRYGETTFILQFPVWWAFACSAIAAIIAAIISLWLVGVRARQLGGGPDVGIDGDSIGGEGTVH